MAVKLDDIIDGKFRITRLRGRGRTGAVYAGLREDTGERIVVTVLAKQLVPDAAAWQRLKRALEQAGRVVSPNIVRQHAVGEHGGDRYLVTEHLDGETLEERLEQHPSLAAHHIVPIVLQLLRGLGAAHDAGLEHHELRLSSVFLKSRGTAQDDLVKILDLGMPALERRPRSDLHAVGAILYRTLSGKPARRMDLHTDAPELDADLAAIVERALHRDPAKRYLSARTLFEALAAWHDPTGLARPSYSSPPPAVDEEDRQSIIVSDATPARLTISKKQLLLLVAVVVLGAFAALLVALTDQDDELDAGPVPSAALKSISSSPSTSGAVTPTSSASTDGQTSFNGSKPHP